MTSRIILAPMEGVVDHHVRALLTEIGGIDQCVTEFVRVNDQVLPAKVFHRLAPEIRQGCKTPSGIPVKVQILGGNPASMAVNALEAVKAGADAIDINFGCPAKTVNRSDGGACLLREPDRVYRIVRAVRDALPAHIPLSAKIRLGFDDRLSFLDNARAVADGGAAELAVHARSKADGYRPPAYWEYIAGIRAAVAIPVIANGEVWSLSDYHRCREVSGSRDIMIGRGLLACPDLARQIKADLQGKPCQPMSWRDVCQMLLDYFDRTRPFYDEKNCGNRIKQWLVYLRLHYPQANDFFEAIKRKRCADDIREHLCDALRQLQQAG